MFQCGPVEGHGSYGLSSPLNGACLLCTGRDMRLRQVEFALLDNFICEWSLPTACREGYAPWTRSVCSARPGPCVTVYLWTHCNSIVSASVQCNSLLSENYDNLCVWAL